MLRWLYLVMCWCFQLFVQQLTTFIPYVCSSSLLDFPVFLELAWHKACPVHCHLVKIFIQVVHFSQRLWLDFSSHLYVMLTLKLSLFNLLRLWNGDVREQLNSKTRWSLIIFLNYYTNMNCIFVCKTVGTVECTNLTRVMFIPRFRYHTLYS